MNKVYIETTIPSYYVARPSANLIQAARQAMTRKWWDEGCSGLEAFTSQETLDEISRGEHGMAMLRMDLMSPFGDSRKSLAFRRREVSKRQGG